MPPRSKQTTTKRETKQRVSKAKNLLTTQQMAQFGHAVGIKRMTEECTQKTLEAVASLSNRIMERAINFAIDQKSWNENETILTAQHIRDAFKSVLKMNIVHIIGDEDVEYIEDDDEEEDAGTDDEEFSQYVDDESD